MSVIILRSKALKGQEHAYGNWSTNHGVIYYKKKHVVARVHKDGSISFNMFKLTGPVVNGRYQTMAAISRMHAALASELERRTNYEDCTNRLPASH